jgi:hypothetical protein
MKERRGVTVYPCEKCSRIDRKSQKSPLIPLFQRGNYISSLWKREIGRDFWELFPNR